jgi:hypothetical protein
MEVICSYGRDYFVTGDLGTAIIKFNDFSAVYENYIVGVQACGFINSDPRWLKSTKPLTDSFTGILANEFSRVDHLPTNPTACETSACIFTSTEFIMSKSYENEFIVIFSLPNDCLPSYRGLCASLSYSLILSLKHRISTYSKEYNFPFILKGTGCPEIPYSVRYFNKTSHLLITNR